MIRFGRFSPRLRRLVLEHLEDRHLLASLWGSDSFEYPETSRTGHFPYGHYAATLLAHAGNRVEKIAEHAPEGESGDLHIANLISPPRTPFWRQPPQRSLGLPIQTLAESILYELRTWTGMANKRPDSIMTVWSITSASSQQLRASHCRSRQEPTTRGGYTALINVQGNRIFRSPKTLPLLLNRPMLMFRFWCIRPTVKLSTLRPSRCSSTRSPATVAATLSGWMPRNGMEIRQLDSSMTAKCTICASPHLRPASRSRSDLAPITGGGFTRTDSEVATAEFSVAGDIMAPPPPPDPNIPLLRNPPDDATVDTANVTLQFDPIPGYSGRYFVRLDDTQWDGTQAAGFQHDCQVHYLCVATSSTGVTVPVRPGADYRWWVHSPDSEVAAAEFSVAGDIVMPPPPPDPNIPLLLNPPADATVDTAEVTLQFDPIPGYSGRYFVRLDDTQWDGTQAAGFQHDCQVHYLCVATSSTSVTVPVRPGADYRWWVHLPDSEVATAEFSVAGDIVVPPPPPDPNIPLLLSPRDECHCRDGRGNAAI